MAVKRVAWKAVEWAEQWDVHLAARMAAKKAAQRVE
jgi:hypothetical protein